MMQRDDCSSNPQNSHGTRHMAVVGMFDGVHTGHRYLLGELKKEAARRGLAPMAITFSNHPLEIIAPEKAPALLTTPAEKRMLIEREGVEGIVIPFDDALRQTDAEGFLGMLRNCYGVEALLMGFNNRFGHNAPAEFNEYRQLGENCGIEIIPASEYSNNGSKVSSTAIRQLLAAGNIEEANRLLGRKYTVSGIVEEGKQLGRKIGFPTANLRPDDPRQLLPAGGVYATTAIGHPSMTNIGSRPTVDINGAPTVETHIIGFDGNLYGSHMTLAFRHRLRPEMPFPSLEALKAQLETDRTASLRLP